MYTYTIYLLDNQEINLIESDTDIDTLFEGLNNGKQFLILSENYIVSKNAIKYIKHNIKEEG